MNVLHTTRNQPKPLALVIALVVSAAGCETIAGKLYLPKEGIRPAEYSVNLDPRVTITMRDGTPLVSRVYRPAGLETAPVVLSRIPYSTSWRNRLMTNILGRFWASRGYAVVIQQTRGRGPSGGEFYPMRPHREDGIDTLRWLFDQPWCDGRVGMWGGSSFGYAQWSVVDQTEPGPSTYMIQIASSRAYDAFYHGGAFALESALYWAYRSHRDWNQVATSQILDRGAYGFPLIEADDRAMGDVPFFNDWARHITRDEYWQEIDGEARPERLEAPVHLMAGWFDPFLPAQLDDYVQIQEAAERSVADATRLVIGPWAHARTVTLPGGVKPQPYRTALLRPTIDWFDTHLAGTSDAAYEMPRVKLFVMGKNEWRAETEWPLSRAKYTPYYLRSTGNANSPSGGGALTLLPPSEPEPPDPYVYNPRDPVPMAGGAVLGNRAGPRKQNDVAIRQDVLVYTSPELQHETEVTGPIQLVLYVTTTAPSTDFTAKLVDVHPDGNAYNVSDGILRRSYSNGDQPTEISIEMWPTSMVFFEGHRIGLHVSSSNFPRFDRNPNTGEFIPTETGAVPAYQQIHHSPETPSRLILPIVPAGDDVLIPLTRE